MNKAIAIESNWGNGCHNYFIYYRSTCILYKLKFVHHLADLQYIICFRNVVGYKNLGAAAWFTTSCDEKSPAYSYVQKLGYHTLVDVFGPLPCGDRCPQNKSEICLKLLRLRYRVTLVLENHSCNHTIPEMFYLALEWVYIVWFICNVLFLKIVTPTKCSDW